MTHPDFKFLRVHKIKILRLDTKLTEFWLVSPIQNPCISTLTIQSFGHHRKKCNMCSILQCIQLGSFCRKTSLDTTLHLWQVVFAYWSSLSCLSDWPTKINTTGCCWAVGRDYLPQFADWTDMGFKIDWNMFVGKGFHWVEFCKVYSFSWKCATWSSFMDSRQFMWTHLATKNWLGYHASGHFWQTMINACNKITILKNRYLYFRVCCPPTRRRHQNCYTWALSLQLIRFCTYC